MESVCIAMQSLVRCVRGNCLELEEFIDAHFIKQVVFNCTMQRVEYVCTEGSVASTDGTKVPHV